MTYFHAVIPRTIIGAAAFHGPVREGKAWFHRAMVVRNSVGLGGYPGSVVRSRKCALARSCRSCTEGL